MKVRLIDANALKEAFKEDGHLSGYIEEFIDDTPTIDAVHVVRCKDCKYGKIDEKTPLKPVLCELLLLTFHQNAFCSYGVRKDET